MTLAEQWCALNRWEWPKECGEPEKRGTPYPNRRSQIMAKISEEIGIKECLREWNRETMPGVLFDDWWGRGQRMEDPPKPGFSGDEDDDHAADDPHRGQAAGINRDNRRE